MAPQTPHGCTLNANGMVRANERVPTAPSLHANLGMRNGCRLKQSR